MFAGAIKSEKFYLEALSFIIDYIQKSPYVCNGEQFTYIFCGAANLDGNIDDDNYLQPLRLHKNMSLY